jgi:glycosyltransferase involved in cell wall biosynthesis
MTSNPAASVPLVSIVIPTCNRRAVLEKCLQALVSQTYPNYEVIVVDDASIDDTPQMLAQFQSTHGELEIRWYRNEVNSGANVSRNRGVKEARGEFVAFLDSDCIAENDWLERLQAGFTSDRVAACTGMVLDPPATNIYELSFRGSNRVHGAGPAPRLVGGNMSVRRELLIKHAWDEDRRFQSMEREGVPDVTNSGGCDEEGLFLILRAAGYEQKVIPDARVLHEHAYDRRAFFRQAYFGGGSAAHLVYKYHLPPRIDVLPFIFFYAFLPLGLFDRRLLLIPAIFLIAACSALIYNELARKGKKTQDAIASFPFVFAYYHVRVFAYVREMIRLWTGRRVIRRIRL